MGTLPSKDPQNSRAHRAGFSLASTSSPIPHPLNLINPSLAYQGSTNVSIFQKKTHPFSREGQCV